jgi:hypothetical protein
MGGFGPNLRGSFRPEPRRVSSREVRYLLERIEIKIPLKELPAEYALYPGYRFRMKQKIRSCGLPGSILTPFLLEMDTLNLMQLKGQYLRQSDVVINLEAKPFTALLDAAQDKSHLRHSTAIITECNEGAGREAI